jgi:hypothetical protein
MIFSKYTSVQIIVHHMPWFQTPGHVALNYRLQTGGTVPYNSASPTICDDQCGTMRFQGVSIVNSDFFGITSPCTQGNLAMLNSCQRAGLKYFICLDPKCVGTLTGQAATNAYIAIGQFAQTTLFPNPAYLKDAGRNVINVFAEPPNVDWGQVYASFTVPVALVFQGSSAFTHPNSAGGFGWVNPTTPASNINIPAVQAFLAAAAANPGMIAMYPAYAGFDDSAASWGQNRVMSRLIVGADLCGGTMLQTLALVPKTATYCIIPTWNDYEEGTNVETAGTTEN